MKRSRFYILLFFIILLLVGIVWITGLYSTNLIYAIMLGLGIYLIGISLYECNKWARGISFNVKAHEQFPASQEEQFVEGVYYMSEIIYQCAVEHGWWDDPNPNDGEKIALMHSELSEALEALRKDLQDDKITNFSGVEAELADCVIRIFDYCKHKNLRIGEAILEKHKYNMGREYKHGGKKF